MHILCVHGMGQNGEIFEALTGNLRAELPHSWTYYFMDGKVESLPAPGVSEIFPGPYLCHGQTYDTSCIKEQHKYIWSIIEEEGPFDGVMAFSQGAAIVASVMLHYQREHPLEPPLFRFAIFCAGSLPFTTDPSAGTDVTTHYARSSVDATLRSLISGSGWGGLDESLEANRTCCQFVPGDTAEKIEVPTVHVYDKDEKSPYLSHQHPALFQLCRSDGRMLFNHNSGHKMPSRRDENKAIAQMVVRAVEVSKIQV